MPDNYPNTRIKKLSPLLINQLAAGEVVTRPAAVVKELLENAIDAGATNIEVRITQGGMGLIEVVDNGVGIHPDDMVMAITRHATSKVADVANLHGITTLGFRGEALAAMAAVSRLTLTSSHDESGIGRQLQVAGVLDDIPKLLPVVHNRGTTIVVKDLYFNVPARRGNLKSIATEFGHIETIVREVALARADIALTLYHDNKQRLSLSASATSISGNNDSRLPLPRLEQATGMALTDNALAISIDLSSLIQSSVEYDSSNANQAAISGWLWPLHYEKSDLPKLIYVNGRLVKEALISNQIRQLAQGAQLVGMGYALYFDLPTQWLNINVHPSKQRIKISPLNNIMAHLGHTVRTQLKTINVAKFGSESAFKSVPKPETDSQYISEELSNEDASESRLSEMLISSSQSSNNPRQHNKVESNKQSYQSTANQSLSYNPSLQESARSYINERSDQSNNSNNSTSHYSDGAATSASLPICLDIINDVEAVDMDLNTDDKKLPWLLFYHQGQCALISAKDWQFKVSQLFESLTSSQQVFKKDRLPSSATEINQQLISVNTQMSAQDSIVFANDLTEIIMNNAIKAIDSHLLVKLMLS
ncbi:MULTISPECIES: DNA mismatch repair endonuclease MutL [Psychrobacter]|uniref:DNA mismatch repair endonuclease MutL n=1 Tax=Psychrobacter TaxID=497 RepID=UPI00086DEB6A|nr:MULTISPECIES: DNA mismatch repair endonuclease MutL [Psychrobacter]MBA6243182.1 ATP-binding protein [Psychrobacter sp. Urea-trap-18]MBA6286240.1 ATP-binding protein [Psychrobacter sp. Urea-trap-16]MBA6317389.1 ATP-binding protein [Psychrobacter sp. Urea-trap-20]MBA6334583.1 ATP-binding protein [Psychrobacter sp. Urea-trap-19]OEH68673.1 MAG: ATPase [Psychrobacter sp. B29-1]|tara:strand:- start:3598 stop:5376 length:1779 start_codon:yes stop_codon:yes gene_type:complete